MHITSQGKKRGAKKNKKQKQNQQRQKTASPHHFWTKPVTRNRRHFFFGLNQTWTLSSLKSQTAVLAEMSHANDVSSDVTSWYCLPKLFVYISCQHGRQIYYIGLLKFELWWPMGQKHSKFVIKNQAIKKIYLTKLSRGFTLKKHQYTCTCKLTTTAHDA